MAMPSRCPGHDSRPGTAPSRMSASPVVRSADQASTSRACRSELGYHSSRLARSQRRTEPVASLFTAGSSAALVQRRPLAVARRSQSALTICAASTSAADRAPNRMRLIQHKQEAFWFYRFLSIVYDHVGRSKMALLVFDIAFRI